MISGLIMTNLDPVAQLGRHVLLGALLAWAARVVCTAAQDG
jgi:hypothetical protein